MRPPTDTKLFELLDKFDPKHTLAYKDISVFIKDCKSYGFEGAADFLEQWKIYIDYQIEAEWHVRNTTNTEC